MRKKYHHINGDLLSFIDTLESGQYVGADRIESVKSLHVYKARIKNSSSSTGKSGGFRVIYYTQIDEETFYLLSIYSKSQKSDISRDAILEILKSENLIK